MANPIAFTNGFVSIGGNDLSAYGHAVNLDLTLDTHEVAVFGNTSKPRIVGLKDATASIEFFNSFDDNELDEILFGLYDAAVAVAVLLRADGGAIAVGNPEYQLSMIITSYSPFQASVNTPAGTTIQLVNALGTSMVVRDVVP